jgi:hypothetical protein
MHDVDRSSSLVTSVSTAVGWLKGQIDATAANGARWGSHSMLVAIVLNFPEWDADLEGLRYGHHMGLIEGEVDALWSLLQLPVTLPTAWGSSGGSLCSRSFCFCLSMNNSDKFE